MILQQVSCDFIVPYSHSTNFLTCVGQPVGWCITDKEDRDVVKIFLEKIKLKSPGSEVLVIITDDGRLFFRIMVLNMVI